MDKVATALNADFFLAVGDNYYHYGVTDENDPRFKATFEDVYSTASLQKPWYPVFGNHDYKGYTSAPIAYSSHSSRWQFPSKYYLKSFTAEDGTAIDLVMIDTIDLSSMTEKEEHEEGYFNPLPLLGKEYASNQWTWIENTLKASTADHILVVGHYPVYSACDHGNTDTLIASLLPMLKQYNAHYLNGHDHCQEHIVEPGVSVNHFLVGMGSFCCYRLTNTKNIPKDSLKWYMALDNRGKTQGAFASFEVSKSGLIVNYYDDEGTVIYSIPAIPSRKSSSSA
jgi:tartrate-resistant acid phosphatase type 5